MKHLWEVEHAYYCEDYNYRARADEAHLEYETWEDFLAEMGEADFDMNMLFRWDWKVPTEDDRIDGITNERLCFYYMMQRKGDFRVFIVNGIKREQEAEVIEFLKPRLQYLKDLWEPVA